MPSQPHSVAAGVTVPAARHAPDEVAAAPARALRTGLARALAWPSCVLLMVAHLAWAHNDFPTSARVYAGLLACVALLAAVYSPMRVVPALAIALASFYAACGLPVFSPGTTVTVTSILRLPPRALSEASLGAVVLAATVLVVTMAVDRLSRGLGQRYARALAVPTTHALRPGTLWLIAGLSFVLDLAVLRGWTRGSLMQVALTLGAPAMYLPLMLWTAQRWQQPFALWIVWGAVGIRSALGLLTGMLSNTLLAGIVTGALLWTLRGRIPIWLGSIGVVALLVFNPAKMAYRELSWSAPRASLGDRLEMWATALEQTYGDSQDPRLETNFDVTARRLNTLGQIGQVFDWVPQRIPHAGPDKWLMTPQLLIPRVFWPDKPIQEEFYNRDYTYTFRIQQRRGSESTSITLPSVADGYWRLGWLGILVEGAVFGILLGIAQGFSRTPTLPNLVFALTVTQFQISYHAFGIFNAALQQFLIAAMLAVILRWSAVPVRAPPASRDAIGRR